MRCLAWIVGMAFGLRLLGANPVTSPAELFRLDRVWDVELSFSRDQWRALQPKEPDGRSFPGGPTVAGTNGIRGGPAVGGGPRFGLGTFLGSPLFKAADVDLDGKLTRAEFEQLGRRWMTQWDPDKSGKLDAEKLKTGFTSVMDLGDRALPGIFSLQGREGRRNGLSGARGIEFNFVHADLKFDGVAMPDVAVRYKGHGTYMQSARQMKRPMKVDLNEFTRGQKLAGVSKLNFHNSITDASWMNEALAYRLYRDAGVPAPRVGYARLRLNVQGELTNSLAGLYTLVENVDAAFAEDVMGTRKGLLLKPSTSELFKYLGSDWEKYKQTYDPKTPVFSSQAKRVIDFCQLLTEADDATFAAKAAEYVDFDEVSRFLAVTVWISTLDGILGMGQNFIVHLHPKTSQLQLIPWDLDHAFGQFGLRGSQEEREQLSIRGAWNADVRFLTRLMQVPAFEQAYLDRMREFQAGIFKPARLTRQVDELAAVIRDSVKLEGADKLERFDKVVAGEPVPVTGLGEPGGPRAEGARPAGTWPPVTGWGFGGNSPKPIKGFVPARHESVAAQLDGRSPGRKLGNAFDPGRMLAGRFLEAMDENQDGALSEAELVGRFGTWFREWDKNKAGAMDEEALKDGLTDVFAPKPE